MSSTIGERIRIAREAKGWSQLKLGEAVGVSRAAVSQWESGESKGLKPENLVAAARELGVDIEWLVTGTPDMREDRSRYRSDDSVSGTGVPLLD
ncbi:helix-turn-helix domain-containing protein [Plasticicumulans acidivorans]|uniref:Helix-turn-helix protein n=1 Tax=Plasticicumulans acidivorans TaxID=886464 RepID=A0A317MQR0_9GAMM|nr:helix-turn-helix transcriptional regulator [Plasticicumulans acidivorans]PWV58865.1 helix-turn-helix protein [Plasticicumulans acidivorans]